MSRARLLSIRGELSLDGRALLYWLRLSPREREKSPVGPPRDAMRRILEAIDSHENVRRFRYVPPLKFHPSMQSRVAELVSECRRVVRETE